MKASAISRTVVCAIAVCYAYGGLVHLANIAGMSGYSWASAPLKWQLLDSAYLGLDVAAVIGLVRRARWGLAAFFIAALSQIILYTLGADWVMAVPAEYLPDSGHEMSLTSLVVFHVVTLIAMCVALKLDARAFRR